MQIMFKKDVKLLSKSHIEYHDGYGQNMMTRFIARGLAKKKQI
jgi:hypothetical protein